MDQAILVYVDLMGSPLKVGKLWGHFRNGRESMSFEYDHNWLNHPKRFSFDPALKLVAGFFHASPDKPIFGAIDDSLLIDGDACSCAVLREKMLKKKNERHAR